MTMIPREAQRLEDRRFIDEAVSTGKITAEMTDVWLSSMELDRAGVREVIRSRPSTESKVAESASYKAWNFGR